MKKLLLLLLLPIFAVVFASCKPKEEKIDVTKIHSVWDLVGYEYPEANKNPYFFTRIIKGPVEKTFYVYSSRKEPTLDNLFIEEEDIVSDNSDHLRFLNPLNSSIWFTIYKTHGRYSWFETSGIPSFYNLTVRTKI